MWGRNRVGGMCADPCCPRIFGMDFFTVIGRAGERVTKRKRCTSRVGFSHRVTKEDTQVSLGGCECLGWALTGVHCRHGSSRGSTVSCSE
jgi:hypothetical protein